MQYVSQGT